MLNLSMSHHDVCLSSRLKQYDPIAVVIIRVVRIRDRIAVMTQGRKLTGLGKIIFDRISVRGISEKFSLQAYSDLPTGSFSEMISCGSRKRTRRDPIGRDVTGAG